MTMTHRAAAALLASLIFASSAIADLAPPVPGPGPAPRPMPRPTPVSPQGQLCPPIPNPPSPPEGWSYLPEVTAICVADIFRAETIGKSTGPAKQITVDTQKNVGILEHPVDVALTPATTLSWKWNVTKLPSKVAEDAPNVHDYLSIAVKFDNGQDLTYMWSAVLPKGKGFPCPLPDWTKRETHVVARSGAKDLGRWLSEKKNVMADYKKHIGGKLPTKITHVWLIANSVFQQGEAQAAFGDITLASGKKSTTVRVF
jgi:hypothetical protein